MSKRCEITVTLKRTVQLESYTPVTIELTETREVLTEKAEDYRTKIYKSLSEQAERFIKNEQAKHLINTKSKKDRK